MSSMPGTMEPREEHGTYGDIGVLLSQGGLPLSLVGSVIILRGPPPRMPTGLGFMKGRWCAHVACGNAVYWYNRIPLWICTMSNLVHACVDS